MGGKPVLTNCSVRAAVLAATLVGVVPQTVSAAQDPPPAPAQQPATVDVSKLPLDLTRVQRALRASDTREERDGLKLNYFVNVYGQTPRIQLFTKADNLAFGRAPYGGPTHNEMLEVMTPQEFRAPAMNLGAAMKWLTDKAKDKSR
jgi:hypothetical protein